MQRLYLCLALLGAVLPYAAFLPWLQQYGLDLPGANVICKGNQGWPQCGQP